MESAIYTTTQEHINADTTPVPPSTIIHKPKRDNLTREEKTQIRKMIGKGMNGPEICAKMGMNIRTYYNLRTRLNKELGLHDIDKEALFSEHPKLIFKTQIAQQLPRRGKRGSAIQAPIVRPLAEGQMPIELATRETIPPLKDWVEQSNIILDGEPFTFIKHEYLIEPYTEDHPFTVDQKATQMGLTSLRMLMVIYRARFRHYRGILYYFPTKTDVIDFSRSRIAPLIEENPDTIGNYIQETNSITVKKLWNCFLFFRGMNSAISVKSQPADCIIFDELDEAQEDRMEMAMKRLSHSQFKEIAMLSNPTLPDYGINRQFQRCVAPDTKILRTDLHWYQAKELKVGDELVGFDEESHGNGKSRPRRYRATKVTCVNRIDLPCFKLYFDDGTEVVCSKDHRWLTERATNVRFKFAKNLKIGDKVISIGTWKEIDSRMAGWMAGIFDGEGSVSRTTKKAQISTIGFGQNPGIIFEKVKKTLSFYGFQYSESQQTGKCRGLRLKGGLPERLRFLGTFRPYRLIEQSKKTWEGISVGKDGGLTKKPKLVRKEEFGIKTLIALGTEHGTYIANGLLSHNSDMRYWLLKCPKCGQSTCMEDTFPECIVEWNGKVVRLCQSCRDAELDPSIGEWVAKRPSITNIRGRNYSQLFSAFVSPQEILDEYNNTSHIKQFYNLTIGTAFVEAENRLTVREVLDLCRDEGMAESDLGPCSMGVDQMSHSLHVTIGKRVTERAGKIVHIGIYKDWIELDKLMERFHVNRCVCDLQPETRNARAFGSRHKGRVFLNFYRERQKGDYIWDEEKMMVLCNRTESLDASHYEVQEANITFPKECDIMKVFADQLHNAGKELVEEKDKDGKLTGAKRYVYKKLGVDHFRHSYNYECMARQYQVDLLFPELL